MDKTRILSLLEDVKKEIISDNGAKEAEEKADTPLSLFKKIVFALLSVPPDKDTIKKRIGQAIYEMYGYIHTMEEETQYLFCIYAVNLVDNIITEHATVKSRFSEIHKKLLCLIEAGKYTEIVVPLGDKFDETFSPSKYERKQVKSDKPTGVIIGIEKRGFLDSNGVCIQKAIVLVAKSQ